MVKTTAPYTMQGLAYPHNACNPTCIAPLYDVYVSEGLVDNIFGMCLIPKEGGIIDLGFVFLNFPEFQDSTILPSLLGIWHGFQSLYKTGTMLV